MKKKEGSFKETGLFQEEQTPAASYLFFEKEDTEDKKDHFFEHGVFQKKQ